MGREGDEDEGVVMEMGREQKRGRRRARKKKKEVTMRGTCNKMKKRTMVMSFV